VKTIKGGLEFDEKIHLPHKNQVFPLPKEEKYLTELFFLKIVIVSPWIISCRTVHLLPIF
jgi:hypothetical protein